MHLKKSFFKMILSAAIVVSISSLASAEVEEVAGHGPGGGGGRPVNVNRPSQGFNRPVPNFSRPAPVFNRPSPGFQRPPPPPMNNRPVFNRPINNNHGPIFNNRPTPTFNRPAPVVNRPSPGFQRPPPPMNNRPVFNRPINNNHGPIFNNRPINEHTGPVLAVHPISQRPQGQFVNGNHNYQHSVDVVHDGHNFINRPYVGHDGHIVNNYYRDYDWHGRRFVSYCHDWNRGWYWHPYYAHPWGWHAWGWVSAPWYGWWGWYWHPWYTLPVWVTWGYGYPGTPYWVSEYVIADYLADDYAAGYAAGYHQGYIAGENAGITQTEQQQVVNQVSQTATVLQQGQSLDISNIIAQYNQDPNYLFFIDSPSDVSYVQGGGCTLRGGDVIKFAEAPNLNPDPNDLSAAPSNATKMTIIAARNCRVGQEVYVSYDALQGMLNTFASKVDAGQQAQQSQTPNGLTMDPN